MWKLKVPREALLQYGFVYDQDNRRYIQEVEDLGYSGEAYVNDGENFLRMEMLCIEGADWEDDTFEPDHIANRYDWRAEELEEQGCVVWIGE